MTSGPPPPCCNDESTRWTAAALSSRVFFHLEEPRQALRLALESGDEHFDVLRPANGDCLYIMCLVNTAIKEYILRKGMEFDGEEEEDDDGRAVTLTAAKRGTREEEEDKDEEELDMSKLVKVMQLMFQWCYRDGFYGHALGVAFESRECGRVEEILDELSSGRLGMDALAVIDVLGRAMTSAHDLIPSKAFRSRALSSIADSLDVVFCGAVGVVKANAVARRNAACALVLCRQLLGRCHCHGGDRDSPDRRQGQFSAVGAAALLRRRGFW